MDIEKDSNREAFESWFESRYDANFMQFALDLDMYVDKHTQTSWEAWQAAKAQAIPDGFVVVSTKDLNIIYDQINDWNTDWSLVFGLFNRILGVQEPAK